MGINYDTGVYHVFNKSIARYTIFSHELEFSRFIETVDYYQLKDPPLRLSYYLERNKPLASEAKNRKIVPLDKISDNKLVEIIAYCIMPTHFHILLRELCEGAASVFMRRTLNSYTHYFNKKNKRKGPLWESRFKKVMVESDEQLVHLTRYIHLNPVTAYLVDNPADWEYSSYKQYLGETYAKCIDCQFNNLLDITPQSYKEFCQDSIAYQRDLASIKRLTLEGEAIPIKKTNNTFLSVG
ncbi:MAG: transposase [Candidatus Omnitrophota bacterium]